MANDLFKKLMSFQDTRPPVPLMDPNAEDEPKQEDFEVAQEPVQLGQMPKPDLARRQQILDQFKSFRSPAVEEKPTDESELEQHLNSMDKADNDRVDQEIASADFDQQAMTGSPEMDMSSISPREKVLSDFQRLMQAQKAHQGNLGNLAMLQGANTIAQGFALGRGAKIGNNAEGIAALERASAQAPKDIMDQMKLGGTDMNDPQSDISKFTRAQAYAMLKKIAPNEDYTGKLDEMSAAQLAKLPGMKNVLGQQGRADWVATDRVLSNGHPVKFNKMTGDYVDGITGEAVNPNDTIVRDIARKDELTGQYGYVSRNGGMQVMPTNYNNATVKPKQATVNEEGETVQAEAPKYSDFAKAAPKQADEFRKMQKEFNQDMKDSRDVATSITNLASKLKPGPGGKIDSGVLGSVQTQAAKMSGQKGVLTDQDLVKFAGAGGVAAKIERIIDGSFFGEMSESDVKFFKRFSELMSKSLDSDIQNRAQIYKHQARQLVETTVPDITDDTIGEWLGVNKVAPITQKSNSEKIDPKIDEYAKAHKLTYDQALSILTKRGYKPNGK